MFAYITFSGVYRKHFRDGGGEDYNKVQKKKVIDDELAEYNIHFFLDTY